MTNQLFLTHKFDQLFEKNLPGRVFFEKSKKEMKSLLKISKNIFLPFKVYSKKEDLIMNSGH